MFAVTEEVRWQNVGGFPILPASPYYRECEFCGDRIFDTVYKMIDVATGDSAYVDEDCSLGFNKNHVEEEFI